MIGSLCFAKVEKPCLNLSKQAESLRETTTPPEPASHTGCFVGVSHPDDLFGNLETQTFCLGVICALFQYQLELVRGYK